jgi:hypothetical protein
LDYKVRVGWDYVLASWRCELKACQKTRKSYFWLLEIEEEPEGIEQGGKVPWERVSG